MKFRIGFIFFFILLSSISWGQSADSISQTLDPVIVSGNKLQQKRTEAPILYPFYLPSLLSKPRLQELNIY